MNNFVIPFLFLFVSARKPIITPVINENVTFPTSTIEQQTDNNKYQVNVKHFTPFSIDNIVDVAEPYNNKQGDLKETLIELPIKRKEIVANHQVVEQLHEKVKAYDINISNVTDRYSFADKSSEVKHALTPINRVPTETYSPQLPLPSPNYPIQAQSVSEPVISINLVTTGVSICLSSTSHKTVNSKPDSSIHSIMSLNKLMYKKNMIDKEKLNKNTKLHDNSVKMNIRGSLKPSSNILNVRKFPENNFTVLNIPNIPLTGPPSKRQKFSTIDLALLKHKMRKQKYRSSFKELTKFSYKDKFTYDYGVKITGPSDSSSSSLCSSSDSEDDSAIDLFVKTGPPLKPDTSNEKLEFLKIFQLTTQSIKTGMFL